MLKYCSKCYDYFETEEDKCPECGGILEEAPDEETDAEYMELLFNHIRA